MALWVVTLCASKTVRCFGGIYRLHLEDRKVSQARKAAKAGGKLADFLFGPLFSSENGGDMFL
jgi:hypothetical protein